MKDQAKKLSTFHWRGVTYSVNFVETMQVKEGVSCDIYAFQDNDSMDLAIVTVSKGASTPLQRILLGEETVEGYVEGEGRLVVTHQDGEVKEHPFSAGMEGEVVVEVGQLMQWTADQDSDVIFYEICTPPYQDGRFENLPE